MDGISVVIGHSLFECNGIILSLDVRLCCCVLIYITTRYDLHFIKFLLVWFFNYEFS